MNVDSVSAEQTHVPTVGPMLLVHHLLSLVCCASQTVDFTSLRSGATPGESLLKTVINKRSRFYLVVIWRPMVEKESIIAYI